MIEVRRSPEHFEPQFAIKKNQFESILHMLSEAQKHMPLCDTHKTVELSYLILAQSVESYPEGLYLLAEKKHLSIKRASTVLDFKAQNLKLSDHWQLNYYSKPTPHFYTPLLENPTYENSSLVISFLADFHMLEKELPNLELSELFQVAGMLGQALSLYAHSHQLAARGFGGFADHEICDFLEDRVNIGYLVSYAFGKGQLLTKPTKPKSGEE